MMEKESSRIMPDAGMSLELLGRFEDSRINSIEWEPGPFIDYLCSLSFLGKKEIADSIFLWSGTPMKSFFRFAKRLIKKGIISPSGFLKVFLSGKVLKRFLKAMAFRHPGIPNYLLRAYEYDKDIWKALKRLSPKNIHLYWLELPVTVTCNMSCRYCISLTGLFGQEAKTPLTKDEVLETLKLACTHIKDVAFLRLIGGEPLTCTFLEDIIESVPDGFADEVRIVTNGTVVPESESFWEAVKEHKVVFEVSAYPFNQPLIETLESRGIPYLYLSGRRWRDFGLPGTLPPDRKASLRQFYNCGADFRQAVRGRLNYCARVTFEPEYGLRPQVDRGHYPGSADLRMPDAENRILKNELFPEVTAACGQCLSGTKEAKVIPNGAEQVKDGNTSCFHVDCGDVDEKK